MALLEGLGERTARSYFHSYGYVECEALIAAHDIWLKLLGKAHREEHASFAFSWH